MVGWGEIFPHQAILRSLTSTASKRLGKSFHTAQANLPKTFFLRIKILRIKINILFILMTTHRHTDST